MQNDNKIVPKSVFNLYVKLYCQRRNGVKKKCHNSLTEAIKSWLSLSKTEQELFIAKYNKSIFDYKKKFAESLKNATPYFKKKNKRGCRNVIETDRENGCQERNIGDNVKQARLEEAKQDKTNLKCTNDYYGDVDLISNNSVAIEPTNPSINEPLPEPIPPRLKSGRELYEILKMSGENYVNWESLSISEKRRYQSAILSIKKNYLKNYRMFLESLKPEDLFNYYVKYKNME